MLICGDAGDVPWRIRFILILYEEMFVTDLELRADFAVEVKRGQLCKYGTLSVDKLTIDSIKSSKFYDFGSDYKQFFFFKI